MICSEPHSIRILVSPEESKTRLDRLLVIRLEEISRSRVQALIQAGAVTLGGDTIGDAGYRVKPGDDIVISVPQPLPAEPKPEAIGLSVAYEDEHIIVVDKPAGLVVHPSAGHEQGTLVNALLAHCGDSLSGIGGVRRPGIVHRLDKDTSGLLVVAKTDAAHRGLAVQFEAKGLDGRLSRRYVAVIWGAPERSVGRVVAALGRSSRNRTQIAVVHSGGRSAVTNYRVREVFLAADGLPVASTVDVELETGRTHQIRVHMHHVGHPVMGDPIYGSGFRSSAKRLSEPARSALEHLSGQALHAAELTFEHPVTGVRLSLTSPLPDAVANLIDALRSAMPQKSGSTPPPAEGRRKPLRRFVEKTHNE